MSTDELEILRRRAEESIAAPPVHYGDGVVASEMWVTVAPRTLLWLLEKAR